MVRIAWFALMSLLSFVGALIAKLCGADIDWTVVFAPLVAFAIEVAMMAAWAIISKKMEE